MWQRVFGEGNHDWKIRKNNPTPFSERRGKKKRSGTSEEVSINPTWRMEQRVEENIMTNTHSYSCGTLRNTIHKCSYIKQNSQHNNNIQNSEIHPQIR